MNVDFVNVAYKFVNVAYKREIALLFANRKKQKNARNKKSARNKKTAR